MKYIFIGLGDTQFKNNTGRAAVMKRCDLDLLTRAGRGTFSHTIPPPRTAQALPVVIPVAQALRRLKLLGITAGWSAMLMSPLVTSATELGADSTCSFFMISGAIMRLLLKSLNRYYSYVSSFFYTYYGIGDKPLSITSGFLRAATSR